MLENRKQIYKSSVKKDIEKLVKTHRQNIQNVLALSAQLIQFILSFFSFSYKEVNGYKSERMELTCIWHFDCKRDPQSPTGLVQLGSASILRIIVAI